MSKLKNKLWLWGQDAGTHHGVNSIYEECRPGGTRSLFGLPGTNKMTPFEGACYMGIPNMCRVVMSGLPEPPFENEAKLLDTLDKVIWSVIGDGGSIRNNKDADLDPVIEVAKVHPNIIGGIMDDFMNPKRINLYPPEKLAHFKSYLSEKVGRTMQLWTVIYTQELSDTVKNHLAECDVATMWTWWGDRLLQLDANYEKLRSIYGDEKSVLCGCYMWDYGNHVPLSVELMKYQLDKYYEWLKCGKIDGIIFCSNCCADIGLDAVSYTREWIQIHGDEEV